MKYVITYPHFKIFYKIWGEYNKINVESWSGKKYKYLRKKLTYKLTFWIT